MIIFPDLVKYLCGLCIILLLIFSDIDLLFLHPYKLTVWCEQVIEFILYSLWDLGFRIGQAVRTINDCIKISKDDAMLIGRMVLTAQKLAENLNIDESGYRLLWNTNKDAMQTVFHIHLHLIGGTQLKAI